MNTPDKKLIGEVALIKGISEAFVEKDWYVTQVIRKISKIRYEDFQVILPAGLHFQKRMASFNDLKILISES